MKRKQFDEEWKQIRLLTPDWWSLISEFDLKKVDKAVPYKLDKYVTMLQVKYGYTRLHAKEEITRRLAEHRASEEAEASPAE